MKPICCAAFKLTTSDLAKELKVSDTILDGEIVALDGAGKPGFLQFDGSGCSLPGLFQTENIVARKNHSSVLRDV